MNFEFFTSTQILFGEGRARETGTYAKQLGKRALLVRGGNAARAGPLAASIEAEGLEWKDYPVPGEPSVEILRRGVDSAHRHACDLLIAVGGGSVLDAAKAIAVMATNEGDPCDYLEVIGKGKRFARHGLPVIAIPTTAGTGAEVTRNAVIGAPDRKVKVSMRSAYLSPRIAIIDPELTLDLPPSITAYTGMDALAQLIEPYVSNRANALTDALCLEGIRRASGSLRAAVAEGGNLKARTDMSVASLFSGLALANAKLGVVHGFAGVLGGRYPAPHGAICARLLPVVTKANVRALRDREGGSPVLRRFGEIAAILTGRNTARVEDGISWLEQMNIELEIPSLSDLGIQGSDVEDILDQVEVASSTQGNPIRLSREELREIFFTSL
jgi:alcohol dehydrogenase class IV